ncbi:MAG: hypothetical protein IIB57_05280 [Planctomycetes bacterium]|nr:hypothetical protein [Planctomycetota bacterium]
MIWHRGKRARGSTQIILFEDGEESLFDENRKGFGGTALNNLGHIAFMITLGSGCGNGNAEIHLYDGNDIALVSDGVTSNQAQKINDDDTIVWVRFDFCQNPWQSDIMRYADGQVTQLTTGLFQANGPEINNVGQITFTNKYPVEGGGYQSALKLWENGRIRTITDWGRASEINDNGVIAFNRWHDDNDTWQVWIYIEDDFFQLTDDEFWNFDGKINNAGEIAFHAGNVPFTDIKYMRRIRTGEADFDGHIDLKDAAAFQNCMTGPGDFDGTVGGFDRLCDCRFLDIDHDRDVDRDDYALFATAMTGPQ